MTDPAKPVKGPLTPAEKNQIIELMAHAHLSTRQCAKQVDRSVSTVHAYWKFWLGQQAEKNAQHTAEWRALQTDRMNRHTQRLLPHAYPQARQCQACGGSTSKPDMEFVNAVLKCEEQIAKLNGADAPIKMAHSFEAADQFAVALAQMVMDLLPDDKIPILVARMKKHMDKLKPAE